MTKEEYREYINHPLWVKRRDEILRSRPRKCERCDEQRHLEVHHKTYAKRKMPWEYPDENFEILCERCHAEESSVEYTPSFCQTCNRPIRRGYKTCVTCQEKRIKELEHATHNLLHNQQRVMAAIQRENDSSKPSGQPPKVTATPNQGQVAQPTESSPQLKKSWIIWLVVLAAAVSAAVLVLGKSRLSSASGGAKPYLKRVPSVSGSVSTQTRELGLQSDLTPGSRGSFRFLIKAVRTPSNGNVYLDAENPDTGSVLSVVVFRNRRSAFGDLSALAGKEVIVSGAVSTYRDQRQIIVESPSQISLP